MELELINTLSESKIFRSKSYLSRFSSEQNANLMYLYVLAICALYKTDDTRDDAKAYVSRTLVFNNFDYFRNAGTDLYMLAHIMNDNKFFSKDAFKKFLMDMRLGRPMQVYIYLSKLERELKIKNPNYKNIKRILSNWDKEQDEKKHQAMKILYRELYYISPVAELLKPMSTLRNNNVES